MRRRGSRRAAGRKGEPAPERAAPRCPQWLSKEAKAVWRQLVPGLHVAGILTRIDAGALARYCVLWVRWKKAAAFLEQYGETYPLKDNDGNVRCFQQFPQVAIVNKLSVLMLRIEQEYGLTPSARTRIHVEPPAAPSDKDRFFKLVG